MDSDTERGIRILFSTECGGYPNAGKGHPDGCSGIRMGCSGVRIQHSRGSGEYSNAENMHPDGICWHPDTPRGIQMRRAGCADSNEAERETMNNYFSCTKMYTFM